LDKLEANSWAAKRQQKPPLAEVESLSGRDYAFLRDWWHCCDGPIVLMKDPITWMMHEVRFSVKG